MYSRLLMLVVSLYITSVEGSAIEDRALEEARGKGKYALLTHLAIVLAAKVGLYKIFMAIMLVLAAVKSMVIMAWGLAISKYVPDFWLQYPIHFFYVAATKIFVLKIIYGVIFYVIATKAWHFLLWFIHYLKEKKTYHAPESYVEYDHPHTQYDYGHEQVNESHDSQPYVSYGPSYGRIDKYPQKKKLYDADGSYSVVGS